MKLPEPVLRAPPGYSANAELREQREGSVREPDPVPAGSIPCRLGGPRATTTGH
ncbi:MAG: hypothetical protein WBC13_12580 [Dokdonella sp.]|jgi:hypothetical protein|uniref:hypothetical protein n=1 Tax=Dokdonella sp. TaxID=2291710 RepID=UPI001B726BE7|nr:hypothetical protein [Dokdonella sp.]MCC6441619.1 hypothetical protein [Rhodanobacteraceae bacterium]MBK8123145.1 hypothetical protein [Dokdonella sp.]MBP6327308.1 hypothetical protein [Dokdonella sp.]MBP6329866.1 hypothetical protein [Dokdonella sp.]HNV07972.1 hypothetical protein [Dokdonella sp.]